MITLDDNGNVIDTMKEQLKLVCKELERHKVALHNIAASYHDYTIHSLLSSQMEIGQVGNIETARKALGCPNDVSYSDYLKSNKTLKELVG